jgi:phosphohistidine phosphatase
LLTAVALTEGRYNIAMKLYFVRHASASDAATRDEDRELTPEGEQEARIVGRALAKMGVAPARFFTSPFLRARQTAALVAEAGHFSRPATLAELKNNTSTKKLLDVLPVAPEILLVGHMPSLAEHLAAFTGEDSSKFAMGKASVAAVELPEMKPGSGNLLWMKAQEQLRAVL